MAQVPQRECSGLMCEAGSRRRRRSSRNGAMAEQHERGVRADDGRHLLGVTRRRVGFAPSQHARRSWRALST